MSMPQPATRPRASGGFNTGLGNFSDEHLEENDFQQAAGQKSLAQQTTSAAQGATGGSALQSMLAGQGGANGGPTGIPGAPGAPGARPAPPREISTIPDELIKRPAHDVVKGLQSIFDINALLGINPETDDAETKARKQQQLQRWQKLNQEQQQFAQQEFQKKMKKKQQEEQEEQAKKKQEEQRKAQSIQMPSSPKKGAVGPGGAGKKADVAKLEQDRKTLGGPASAN